MPIYIFRCACGTVVEEFRKVKECDWLPPDCSRCGRGAMKRDTVYRTHSPRAEASQWPYDSDALLPVDPKLRARYKREGRIVPDGYGGESVRVEDAKTYRSMLKEQGLVQMDDYEKINRSVTRPHARRGEFAAARRVKAKARAKEDLKRKGLL